jgi:DNA-binding CsgD family transcriptional regulator
VAADGLVVDDTGGVRQVLCPVLVGRDEEACHIEAALTEAGAGIGGTVLITGEAGVGKSRLVREAVRVAGARGFTVLTGRAVASDVPTPFRPFAEALASAGRAGRLPDSEELGPFRPALSRLVPGWRQPGRVAGGDSLVFLGEAVLRLLRAVSPDGGCLLVLEDLHWAGRETLALTEYLADNVSSERVLCLGTMRDEDGAKAAELATMLEARGSAAVLPLGRLGPADSARMARACVGGAVLPDTVQSLVAQRAEGLPFLIEEVLASLIGDGSLIERDGRWDAGDLTGTPVPATFADAVRRRLSGLDPDSRRVISAAAVLGRRFGWAVLGAVTGLPEDVVVAALRQGVGLQIVVADGAGFRFRHALTHEAVLSGLLPPERALLAGRALAAIEVAHPGLPGTWCTLAAELADGAGDTERSVALLLEAGRRDLAVGALASAEHTLARARGLAGPDDPLCGPVDEALTEVFALSGQVDRAIETGRMPLARLGGRAGTSRAGQLHLGIARAAIAGARWADAAASVEIARGSGGVEAAQVDACAAQVAVGRGHLSDADKLARSALAAAEDSGLAEVACEALEIIGRVARQRDLDAAERAFAQAEAVATAHGLRLWQARALHELGTIDQLRTESVDRLQQARDLASAQGALALTATLDLQIAAGLNKQFRAGEALEAARRCEQASRRFRLATLPMALIFQATAHAIRGEKEAMDASITEAVSLAPEDPDVLGCSWGHCRATFSLLAENLDEAHAQMTTGAGFLLSSPATIAPPFLGVWPLLGALLDREAESAAARVRAAQSTRHLVVGSLLGYADAIREGRRGRRDEACALFGAADAQMGPLVAWYRHSARRVCAQAALADGWGEPVAWLREAADYFAARGDDRVAAACRSLLRGTGAPVPRRRAGGARVPGRLLALGVTERETEVLRLAARGLGNREIADRMFLSPRTVEKHVERLLAKTGLRRDQLATYSADLDT